MSKIITPSVSRKVWYRPAAFDLAGVGAMHIAPGQPLDATILAVWGDRCISAEVKDVSGRHFVKLSATLVQEGDVLPLQGPKDAEGNPTPGGYFEWMPYQLGQAKKEDPPTAVLQTGTETRAYGDGAVDTGVSPLPDQSPAELEAQAAPVFLTEDPDHVKEDQPAATAG